MPVPIPIGRLNRAAEIAQETAERRRRQATDRLRQQAERLGIDTETDLTEETEEALASLGKLWDEMRRRRAVGRRPR